MNLSQSTGEFLFDEFNDDEQISSLESIMAMTGITVGCHKDVLQLQRSVQKLRNEDVLKRKSMSSMTYVEKLPDIPSFIDQVSEYESTIIINQEMLLMLFCSDSDSICKLIRQLEAMPKELVLNVIVDLGYPDLTYSIIDSGSMISNLLRRAKCKKLFNFGSKISIAELMIAMCCDEVYVSEFASVSITKADNGETISRYMVTVYRAMVKATYRFWMDNGLFTADEVAGLFASEADNSIQLLSTEIKSRLKGKLIRE